MAMRKTSQYRAHDGGSRTDRATAPPGIACIIGVQPRNPLIFMNSRITYYIRTHPECLACDLVHDEIEIALAVAGLGVGESVILFWATVATPLVSNRIPSAFTDSSPVLVLNSVPSAPRMSPISHCLNSS